MYRHAYTNHMCYTSLPADSIRILRLKPATDLEAQLEGSLEIVDLTNNPVYEALSYSWDGAFDGDELKDGTVQLGQATWRNKKIISMLKTTRLIIKGNLHNALRRLRFKTKIRDIWIDAICINQNDTQERSSQLLLMARIYSQASCVLMWLGDVPDDTETRTAAEAFDYFQLCFEEGATRSSFMSDYTRDALSKFFQRRYFFRRWMSQEYGHARRLELYCGSHTLGWDVFSTGAQSLASSREQYEFNQRVSQAQSRDTSDILSLLVRYSDLDCKDERDRIYSLLSLWGDRCFPFEPDYTLPFPVIYYALAKAIVVSHDIDVFRLLLIAAGQGEGRHITLPSWAPDWRLPVSGPLPGQDIGFFYSFDDQSCCNAEVNDDASIDITMKAYRNQVANNDKIIALGEPEDLLLQPMDSRAEGEEKNWGWFLVARPCRDIVGDFSIIGSLRSGNVVGSPETVRVRIV